MLKPVNTLNDYVAIIRHIEIPEGIEIDTEKLSQLSNEGVVCGVAKGCGDEIKPGDVVIFQRKNYLALTPSSGGYEGQTIILARYADVVAKIGESTKFQFEVK